MLQSTAKSDTRNMYPQHTQYTVFQYIIKLPRVRKDANTSSALPLTVVCTVWQNNSGHLRITTRPKTRHLSKSNLNLKYRNDSIDGSHTNNTGQICSNVFCILIDVKQCSDL